MSLITPGLSLVTVSDVRKYQTVTVEEEPLIQSLISATESLFESLTGRLWGYRVDYKKVFNFDTPRKRSMPKIWLPLNPVALTSGGVVRVAVKGWDYGDKESESDDLVLDDDFQVIKERGYISLQDYAGWHYWTAITMTGGYASQNLDLTSYSVTPPDAPEDVKLAIIRQVIYNRLRYMGNKAILEDETISGATSRLKEDVHDPFFISIVKLYKRYGYFNHG